MPLDVASGADDHDARSKAPVSIDIETMRLHALSLAARLQSRVSIDTLRPLPMFLGVNPDAGFCFAAGAFTSPTKKIDKSAPEKIKSRVRLNLTFFLSNYVLLSAMTALIVALMHPGMIFFVAIVYGLWTLHSFMIRHELVVFGVPVHSLLTIKQRFYMLFIITAFVIVWKCLVPFLIFVSISAFLVLLHAFSRDPKHIESTNELLEDSDHEASGSSDSEVLVERPKRVRGDVI